MVTTFTILLIDKNDNAPKFNSSEYRVRITELAQVGFALPLFIQAEDKDEVGRSHLNGFQYSQHLYAPVLTNSCSGRHYVFGFSILINTFLLITQEHLIRLRNDCNMSGTSEVTFMASVANILMSVIEFSGYKTSFCPQLKTS